MSASESPTTGRLTVDQFMRSPATTVEADSHVASAAYLMKRSQVSALVITDDEGHVPLAVITENDVSQAVADGRDLNDTRINQLRLPRPEALPVGTPVTAAAEQMVQRGVEHLPVVMDGRLVGMVSLVEVCRALLMERTAS
jgi:CBS domain-containing protein